MAGPAVFLFLYVFEIFYQNLSAVSFMSLRSSPTALILRCLLLILSDRVLGLFVGEDGESEISPQHNLSPWRTVAPWDLTWHMDTMVWKCILFKVFKLLKKHRVAAPGVIFNILKYRFRNDKSQDWFRNNSSKNLLCLLQSSSTRLVEIMAWIIKLKLVRRDLEIINLNKNQLCQLQSKLTRLVLIDHKKILSKLEHLKSHVVETFTIWN